MMVRSAKLVLVVALFCTVLSRTVAKKKGKKIAKEEFEPCDYCYALFKLQVETRVDLNSSATQETTPGDVSSPFDPCATFQGKSHKQCIDFAAAYAPVWSAQMSKGFDFAEEYCQEILVCKATRYHRPFYTSQGFCNKCKEVASAGLLVSPDVSDEVLKGAIAIFMCKTLKIEDFGDNRCIADMLKALGEVPAETPTRYLKPEEICRVFGTCETYAKWYPSRPSTGYFHEVSVAERKRPKTTPHGPHAKSERERTISIPEIPKAEHGKTRYAETHAGYSLPMFRTGKFPEWYKPLVPAPAKPKKKKQQKKSKPKKRKRRGQKKGQKEQKEAEKMPISSPSTSLAPQPETEPTTLPEIEAPIESPEISVPSPIPAIESIVAPPYEEESKTSVSPEILVPSPIPAIESIVAPPYEEEREISVPVAKESSESKKPQEILKLHDAPVLPPMTSEPSQISPEKESGEHELEHDNDDGLLDREKGKMTWLFTDTKDLETGDIHDILVWSSGSVDQAKLIPLQKTTQPADSRRDSDFIHIGRFYQRGKGMDDVEAMTSMRFDDTSEVEA